MLGRYPFRDVPKAFANLSQLARESVPFLSARRCRHFLASIAPQLLRAVAETPDPDEALTQPGTRQRARSARRPCCGSLFSFNPPSLKLYVELCAGSPFLSGLLINNPGMIDELLDSLVLNQPRTADELRAELAELLPRGQRPRPDPAQLPGQGVPAHRRRRPARQGRRARPPPRRSRTWRTPFSTRWWSWSSPRCERSWGTARWKHRHPEDLDTPGEETHARTSHLVLREAIFPSCPYVLLGLGKLGGREISYHSDLDLLLIYEADGTTSRGEPNSSLLHRTGPAGHQHDEPDGADGPALRGGHAAAADGQVR